MHLNSWFPFAQVGVATLESKNLNVDANSLRRYLAAAADFSQETARKLQSETAMVKSERAGLASMDTLTLNLSGHKDFADVFNEEAKNQPAPNLNPRARLIDTVKSAYKAQYDNHQDDPHQKNIKKSMDSVTELLRVIKAADNGRPPNPMSSYSLLATAKGNIIYSMDEQHKDAKKQALLAFDGNESQKGSADARVELERQLDTVHAARKKALEDSFNTDISNIQKLNTSNIANLMLLSRMNANAKAREMFQKQHYGQENVVLMQEEEARNFTFEGVHANNFGDTLHSSAGTDIKIADTADGKKSLSFSYGGLFGLGKLFTSAKQFWQRLESDVLDTALYLKAQGNALVTFTIHCPPKEAEETVRRTYAKLLEAGLEPGNITINVNGKSYKGALKQDKDAKDDKTETVETVFFKEHGHILAAAKEAYSKNTQALGSDEMTAALSEGSGWVSNKTAELRGDLSGLRATAAEAARVAREAEQAAAVQPVGGVAP